MVDLNLWRLEYDDVALDFGTHESGHPFTAQVAISEVELETDDLPHPLSDGIVFGRDLARGKRLVFTGAHLDTMPQARIRRWEPVLDGAAPFTAAWAAEALRQRPGAVATLTNLDRGRMVYGRPRPYIPGLEKVRGGWLTYECGFTAIDGKFYGAAEKVATAGVDPGSLAAFTFPMTFPHTSATPTESRTWVVNDGGLSTWPTITFRQGGDPQVELLGPDGSTVWRVAVARTLAYDEAVTVDCRPWSRAVTLNGTAAPGLLRGSRLDQVRIPAGSSELRLTATDPTGQAEVEVRWRDAFGSL